MDVLNLVLIVLAAVALGTALFALRQTRRPAPEPPDDHPAVAAAAAAAEAAVVDADRTRQANQLMGHLSAALDRIPGGVVVCDAAGGVVFRNVMARRLAEARDSQVLVAAAVQDLLVEAVAGRSVQREVELFGPPSQSYLVQSVPLGDGGLVVIEDQTQDRRTDTVRRDFVANISHELKTPIGALGLLAETIRGEEDSEIVDRLASRMIAESDRASRTVDDLLELTRIEFGDDSEYSEVSVLALVAEAESRISAAAEQAQVSVAVQVPGGLTVAGDRRQLVSALFNLLDNAVKYSPGGSEVVVSAEVPSTGRVRLSVADAGVGIPQRDLDRIFERFYRVDRARSRETGGTGLGLAIVRHVASNHRGEVTVESIEGAGSTFTLSLPSVSGGHSAATASTDQPTNELRMST
jgi:two-component system sensor histidine kinase SenX3